ncbi:MAG: endonuclease domain-containing protein [Gammaproteobacteria bacterium]|nr:endonuclease domain-containing protein [Gammaproteobacteria bacterium]
MTETSVNTRRARTLRNSLTDTERCLWSRLKRQQINGYKFRRQFPLGPYIVDFVSLEARLVIEVDGGQHANRVGKDEVRDKWLVSQDFRVLRFWNNDVLRETDAVIETIVQALRSTPTLFPPGAHENHVRPLGGEKVHWTFSNFRLSPRKGGGRAGKHPV